MTVPASTRSRSSTRTASPNILNDLNVYNAQFGLPATKKCTTANQTSCLAILNQDGHTSPLPPGNTGWGVEISLDVEVAHAICQNCRINLYEANDNTFPSLKTAVNTAAATRRVVAISNSYGGFGATVGRWPRTTTRTSPSRCLRVTVASACSAPHAQHRHRRRRHDAPPRRQRRLRVRERMGGHRLRLLEADHGPAVAAPASNWTAIGCRSKRGIVDVSADANPGTGAAVYDTYGFGGWGQVGGTSLSAPLIAGVYALANNVGNWTYPAQSAYDSPGSLHDVTTGTNGSCSPHPLQCSAGIGYDLPTGIGTPNGLGGF